MAACVWGEEGPYGERSSAISVERMVSVKSMGEKASLLTRGKKEEKISVLSVPSGNEAKEKELVEQEQKLSSPSQGERKRGILCRREGK